MGSRSKAIIEAAIQVREATGTTAVETTCRKLAKNLAVGAIPHMVVGGYAVQANGFPRMTVDVDVVVPDVVSAAEWLSMNGFQQVPGTTSILKDRETKVTVDLMPGGKSVGPHVVPLPIPTEVSSEPVVADLSTIVTQKLSTYIANGISRAKDLGDVVEMIKANDAPRDLPVHPRVSDKYEEIWDELHGYRDVIRV